ncbi:MAG: family 10 glycosylhydrolase [Armatimonadetes bacterium]|nr:family 10 glycosylhydrolase [Armatimonadota bacterium]
MWSILAMASMLQNSQIDVPREFRAAWVATVDNIDWPSKRGLSVAQQRAELKRIVEVADQMHLNALVFQVRPHADAMYKSALEPWSVYLSGTPGKAPSPAYDPLEDLVAMAHAKGIEVHAWFNPYRAWHPAAKTSPNSSHVANTNKNSVRTYGTYLWMDPSEKFVQDRTVQVFMDVAKRYDVDGLHIDDYFYPYPVKDDTGKYVDFPDATNFQKYLNGGGNLSKAAWRRKQVDDVIERVYSELKKTKKWVQFGISPFGIYRPQVPAGITAGIDQYDQLYADCRKWLEEGWCDYMAPQLYWAIAQKAQSYTTLLDWWLSVNPQKRHVYPGSYTGRVMENWQAQEVLDQVQASRNMHAGGQVHFSMKCLLQNTRGIRTSLQSGLYSQRALPPASPWLSTKAAPRPTHVVGMMTTGKCVVKWSNPGAAARFTALVSNRESPAEILAVGSSSAGEITWNLPSGVRVDVHSLRLVHFDRCGQASPAVPVELR